MATHKDCLYKELCESHNDICVTENLQDVDKECPNFKNKADFVEVVRCADCKHLVVYDNCCMYWGHKVSDNDFCSYGERK